MPVVSGFSIGCRFCLGSLVFFFLKYLFVSFVVFFLQTRLYCGVLVSAVFSEAVNIMSTDSVSSSTALYSQRSNTIDNFYFGHANIRSLFSIYYYYLLLLYLLFSLKHGISFG